MEETKKPLTRAEKKDATKEIIKGLLQKNAYKASELIDEAAKEYSAKFSGEETDNANDVRGRIGSVLDVMKKENEILFENGAYAKLETAKEEKPKAKRTRAKKEKQEEVKEEIKEEKPKKSRAKKKTEPLPTPPLQPIAPTAPTSPTTAPEPEKDEKPKAKRVKAKVETKAEKVEKTEIVNDKQEVKEEVKEPQEKHELMDMSFLLSTAKEKKKEEIKQEKAEQVLPTPVAMPVPAPTPAPKAQEIQEKKPAQQKQQPKKNPPKAQKPQTADEKLQEAFLSRLHRLGGEYFEYYCVYLLEKYSKMNGRRLEMLKINGGDHDGGIDGEIEVTDRLGFRETIYIQSKNWDPSKGDEKLWVVGETLLQQFIGACVCRQAKDNKQHARGMFITTSRFTPDAKRILDSMSEKFVGYDGKDLYETAKECGFGIIKRGGEYALDENLLSSTKAFFHIN